MKLPFLPFLSAHLVRVCDISSYDRVLDLVYRTCDTAITAEQLSDGAKVTGVDFTLDLLTIAKEEAYIAESKDIEWKEGNIRSSIWR